MKIVQLIEPKEDILAVYVDEHQAAYYVAVDYLTLADDGKIYGCTLDMDGKYNICAEDNFVGLCKPCNTSGFLDVHGINLVCD